jgi:hypothetical protein
VADSNTKESSPVSKDDDINPIPKTLPSPSSTHLPDLEIQDIEVIGPTTSIIHAKN